jgi:zinc/manganese transport system permease protein
MSVALARNVSWDRLVNFSDYGELVPLVHNALIAGAVLGVLGGVIGVLVITRDLPFAVHGISELSFAGAAAALLLGTSVVAGSLIGSVLAALLIGLLGSRARDRNSIIGVLMPFGLGLGILCLSLYEGRAANKFGLLTGQIVAVDSTDLRALVVVAVVVLVVLALIWRPLMFASVDMEVAAARGVPIRLLGPLFMVLLGCVVALSVQVVGALLVLALLCTPAAAALRVTASPLRVVVLSVAFATTASVGGIFVALGTDIPISPYVTTISFLIYLVCRVVGSVRGRGGTARAHAEPQGDRLGRRPGAGEAGRATGEVGLTLSVSPGQEQP